jgi:hypothetical protein
LKGVDEPCDTFRDETSRIGNLQLMMAKHLRHRKEREEVLHTPPAKPTHDPHGSKCLLRHRHLIRPTCAANKIGSTDSCIINCGTSGFGMGMRGCRHPIHEYMWATRSDVTPPTEMVTRHSIQTLTMAMNGYI